MAYPARQFSLDDDTDEFAEGKRGPAAYPRTDDADEAKYAVYSRALLDELLPAMEPLFLTWTQNLLFLAGLQWWTYDPLSGQFAPPNLPSWREKPVRNLLVPYFKHSLAKLTKNRTITLCIPASTDPEDIQAAKLGDDVVKAKWQELRRGRTQRRALAWMLATGNGYIMPYWREDSGLLHPLTTLVSAVDRETGQQVEIECPCDEHGEPILDEDGDFDIEAEPAYIDIGELADKVLSPFQVFVDAGAECEDDVTFYLIAEPLAVREVHRRWPEIDGIVAEDVSEVERFDSFVTGLAAGADTHVVASMAERDQMIEKTLVLHYFEKPCPEHPGGRHWVSTGRQLLEAPGPLPDGVWPPLIHLGEIDVPGRYHFEATLTAAVGLQREYNEANAHIKEHHNLLLRGKWLVPKGSNIRRGQITSRPGEVIQHTPGLPPKMAELRPLPDAVYQERDRLLQDFETITSIHRISMGDPPPGVTSGRAFLTLQEADDSDFGPVLTMVDETTAEWSWASIQIIQRFYDEDRLLRVSGGNHRYRVRMFKGADLSSIVDVEPVYGSSFPYSQSARQNMMIDLLQTAPILFTDPETGQLDQERIRRLLPLGGEESIGLDSDLDLAEALREEEAYEEWDGMADPETGIVALPIPQPWQNHAAHLRQHSRVLKSATFESWPPLNQQAFLQHWLDTQAEVQAMQLAAFQQELEMEAARASATQPPGGGPPKRQSSNELTDAERDPTTG